MNHSGHSLSSPGSVPPPPSSASQQSSALNHSNHTSSPSAPSSPSNSPSFFGNTEPYRDNPVTNPNDNTSMPVDSNSAIPHGGNGSGGQRVTHRVNIRADGFGNHNLSSSNSSSGGGAIGGRDRGRGGSASASASASANASSGSSHGHSKSSDRRRKEAAANSNFAPLPADMESSNDRLIHRTNRSSAASNSNSNSNSNPSAIQSHNYEPDESEIWRAYVAQSHFKNRGQFWTNEKKRAWKRWMVTMIIGVVQAILAFFCNLMSRGLCEWKYEFVYDLIKYKNDLSSENAYTSAYASRNGDDGYGYSSNVVADDAYIYDDQGSSSASSYYENDDQGTEYSQTKLAMFNALNFQGSAFMTFVFIQCLFAFIASVFVYIEPVSGGSGIPEIKCFLNGINLPRVVRIKTLICKVVGVTFSVSAGLPVGKEGPMVHSGGVVAAAVSQGRTQCGGFDTSCTKFSDFRNDREKRDFVACGAAAGVASAFGAPIGGVLFSLEEGASYWSTKLTWRCFFCAMCTLGTLFWLRNLDTMLGQASMEKLFSFGEFNSLTGEASNFAIWELINFMIIGCLGGLIGAVFNAANENLTLWRMQRVNYSKKRRMVEVFFVSLLVSVVSFLMPMIWNRCTEKPADMQDWSNQEKNLVDALVPFQCEDGQYNEVASLIFTDADTAIKQLFHFREAGVDDASTFSSAALFLFFVPYITLATVVYGIAVPSGLFVPSLLSGAAFGRLCGHLLHKLDHTSGTFADSGTYALMGAAAVLGGMARMTISLTVILLEATGDMQYVLPLMLTLMCARFTGNVFNEGLYDIHIKLKNIPFLEPEVPSIAEKHEIVAGQVMSTDVKCLRPVERAGVVYDLLRNCSHGTFPVVDTASTGTLFGTASRDMLCTLLKRRAFGNPETMSDYDDIALLDQGPKSLSPLVQWDTLERVYPRYPTIDDVVMRGDDRNGLLDLRPYANTAPYTVNETASIQRTYRLFRTLGLRFLCVVNHSNQVVGIITRKDLMPESLSESLMRGRNAHAEVGQFT